MKVEKFINLTPHTIDFVLPGGGRMSWPSAGVARVDSVSIRLPALVTAPDEQFPSGLEFHIEQTFWGVVQGLPAEVPGTVYIVSLIVLQALRGARSDVVAPGTGPNDGTIRYPAEHGRAGQIEAVTRFIVL